MQNLRIDSHQHLWRRARGDYDWLTDDLGVIYRDFCAADLSPLLAKNQIDKTIVVQAAPTLAETEYLLSLAQETNFIAGIVGWVDMEATTAIQTLKALSKNPYFKGIRPMIQSIADPQWMLQSKFDGVFECLIEENLSFDALITAIHLPHLRTLLQRHPKLKAVINHGAKPDIAKQDFQHWAEQISLLGELSNVHCKLSGLLTEAKQGAVYSDIEPYMQHLLDTFSAQRLLWGSDWPVLNLAADYTGWLTMTERFLSPLTERQRAQIMGANACRFYSLGLEKLIP